ncbi:hypothetical protein MUN89_17775 [Halobacillus salinarum]|uniref:Uncharacterized protein n=1 Tax=Halobacillus salinarum TaxID=2932257 RepID=A0ABY4EJL7_9BACI|nr:hypothetical protein [Halobacillus salinarum]UOQ43712.1 hypothetical protein MUN89_17775 [Halobacillus salinarum]
MFKNLMFRLIPHKEQHVSEKRLIRAIKRLKIENYHFNWDRSSCFIEFGYKEKTYRLEHSVEKAKEKGIILRNGLDCINELTQTLEDLCKIIDRGTYKFESWISDMKQSPSSKDPAEFQEEFHIRYKSTGTPNTAEYKRSDEFFPFTPESSLKDFEEKETQRK